MTLTRRITLFILAILVAALLAWVGSPTIIVLPAQPANPVTAYVLVQGYHSSLLLPDRKGGYIQYAYGDWQYFALNQQDWSNAAAALLTPTQGTLGRRQFSHIDNLRQRVDSNQNQTILKIEVAETNAAQLLNALNQRFNRNISTRVENSLNQLSFVQDNQDYTLLHNSNHVLVVWLQDLDCEVRGFVLFPNFKLKSELTSRLIGNFRDALEMELQKKPNRQEFESLLVDLLEEFKINYVRGITEGGLERALEEVEQLHRNLYQV